MKKNKVSFENQKSKIENEIKRLEKSSNTFDKQAYQANKQQFNHLLNELNSLSQSGDKNTVNNSDKSIAPLVLGISGVVVLISLVGAIILRQRRIKIKSKK